MTKQELDIEVDMLKGNINRMCTTDDFAELDNMAEHAIYRIKKIYQHNKDRIITNNEVTNE